MSIEPGKIPIATHHFLQRYLLAFATQAEVQHHVRTQAVEEEAQGLLNFPCFEVHAQFAPGMSGGLVVDEEGRLCGLVCAALNLDDPNLPPLSYAATLWPLLTTMISADRGDAYPRGVSYPAIDLALDGIIGMNHLEDLDPALFPGRTLPHH